MRSHLKDQKNRKRKLAPDGFSRDGRTSINMELKTSAWAKRTFQRATGGCSIRKMEKRVKYPLSISGMYHHYRRRSSETIHKVPQKGV
jgi:hypothetical protein